METNMLVLAFFILAAWGTVLFFYRMYCQSGNTNGPCQISLLLLVEGGEDYLEGLLREISRLALGRKAQLEILVVLERKAEAARAVLTIMQQDERLAAFDFRVIKDREELGGILEECRGQVALILEPAKKIKPQEAVPILRKFLPSGRN